MTSLNLRKIDNLEDVDFSEKMLKFRNFFIKISEFWTTFAKPKSIFENKNAKLRTCLTIFSYIFNSER